MVVKYFLKIQTLYSAEMTDKLTKVNNFSVTITQKELFISLHFRGSIGHIFGF